MPQYRYAHGTSGTIVDALLLDSDSVDANGPFVCVGCGNPLVAKVRGEKRVKHFAHKVQVACSEETYLHRLAKNVFYEEYCRCLEDNEPFFVDMAYPKFCSQFRNLLGHRCVVGEVRKTHDLTGFYDRIMMEKRNGEFIPDLLLSSSRDPGAIIYVEIAVTHFLSEEKQSSGLRVIEIPIECEADIDKIRKRRLGEEDALFLNFARDSEAITGSDCQCAMKAFYCFFVYESGKSFLNQDAPAAIMTKIRKHGDKIRYRKVVGLASADFPLAASTLFAKMVEEAYDAGAPVRNCMLCKYHAPNENNWSEKDLPVFCKLKRQPCSTNAAADCEKYWVRRPRSRVALTQI